MIEVLVRADAFARLDPVRKPVKPLGPTTTFRGCDGTGPTGDILDAPSTVPGARDAAAPMLVPRRRRPKSGGHAIL